MRVQVAQKGKSEAVQQLRQIMARAAKGGLERLLEVWQSAVHEACIT